MLKITSFLRFFLTKKRSWSELYIVWSGTILTVTNNSVLFLQSIFCWELQNDMRNHWNKLMPKSVGGSVFWMVSSLNLWRKKPRVLFSNILDVNVKLENLRLVILFLEIWEFCFVYDFYHNSCILCNEV